MNEIIIKMFLAFNDIDEEDDRGEPPQFLVDQTIKKLRAWLHNQGMEGDLEIVEEDGRHVGLLKVMRPDDWEEKQVMSFCKKCSQYLKKILQGD